MSIQPKALCPFAICVALAVGCEDVAKMQIDSDSTTANPSSFDRSIPTGTARDAVGPPQGESLEGAYDLEDFRGRRVLLVFAGSPDVPAYESLKAAWRQSEGRNEIALVESLLRGSSPEAEKTLPEGENQVMRSRHGIRPAQFKILLIGEEGEVVNEGDEAVTLDELLADVRENTQGQPEQRNASPR